MTTPQEPSYRKRIGYQAGLLGGFTTLATILLVMGNVSTKEPIKQRVLEDLQKSLDEVVPITAYENNLLADPLIKQISDDKKLTIYRGTFKDQVSVLAWEIAGQGYAGEMRFIFAVDRNGRILGVRVLSHAETPGLGDKMEVAKDNWILKFNGLSLGNPVEEKWKVSKDGGQFDAFTGATITPRGIVKAIVDALKYFKMHRHELLTLPIIKKKSETIKTEKNTEKKVNAT